MVEDFLLIKNFQLNVQSSFEYFKSNSSTRTHWANLPMEKIIYWETFAGFQPFIAWYPLKGYIHLNKPAALVAMCDPLVDTTH